MNQPRVLLVIGAMKCGTTTLYHDLRAHPALRVTPKESAFLLAEGSEARDARERFGRLAADCPRGGVVADISTTYAMRPDRPCVALRAVEEFGPRLRVAYVVRDPVKRAISHHRHMHSWRGEGRMDASFDAALSRYPELINFSRYAYQLEPWRAALGDEALHPVVFEEYVRDRQKALTGLYQFLGVDPGPAAVAGRVHNASEGKPILRGPWKRFTHSAFYRNLIRPLAPEGLRDAVRRAVLPAAPPAPAPPSEASVARIAAATRGDVEEVARLLGRVPPWSAADSQRAA